MELKLDKSKVYAIALEGGGAKGAYEVGVWQALDEVGIQYNAVSGTSVGALNGALMTMRDLPRAIRCWNDIRISKVIDMPKEEEGDFKRLLTGALELDDIRKLIPQAMELIRNRGLDVAPLRAWVREVVDVQKVKESDVAFFISTVSLSDRKGLEIKVNDLPEDEICDMLLASAYHPSFRLERLGGKLYADGGFVDTLPLHVLVENGYKDIIAVRIPGLGRERQFKIPEDVHITTIHTNSDLGHVLNFDAEQSRRDNRIGYFDALRVLYGLSGRRYTVERTMSEWDCLCWLLDQRTDTTAPLRDYLEIELPRLARELEAEDGGYFALAEAIWERRALEKDVDPFHIYTDRELLDALA